MSRLTGALLRAFLIAALVIAPSLLLSGLSSDTQQTVALVALFAAVLTCVEYTAPAPGLIEFRDAAPFNRIRFAMLALTVLLLTALEMGQTSPTALTQLIDALALLTGQALDLPYSPVRLATQALHPAAPDADIAAIRAAAGLSATVALLGLGVFALALRSWPMAGRSFNLWINLPTFDPTSSSDIVQRLARDARINLALGFMLPFLMPVLAQMAMGGLDPATLAAPLGMVWVMAAWSFLPASLVMRGMALHRIAHLVMAKRRAAETPTGPAYATV